MEEKVTDTSKYQKQRKDQVFLSKISIVIFLLLLQIAFIIFMVLRLGRYFVYVESACTALSVVVVLYVINKKDNPAYKLAWSVIILLFPLFGGLFYLVVAGNRASEHFIRKMQKSITASYPLLPQKEGLIEAIQQESESAAMQAYYIQANGPYPIYQHTEMEYYSLGDDNMEPFLTALKKAERFIFLEYFIIRDGQYWNSVLSILEDKVAEGVDVRILYDDMGCLTTIAPDFDKQMRAKGIQCYSFNQFIPVLTLRLNNRDHRKIAVVDGYIGFTGGVNIGDEYINLTHPYGHWKDVSVMLKGEAVWSLTVMFLQMWDYVAGIEEDFQKYAPRTEDLRGIQDDGYVQPYSDSPLDDEILGENIYLNMINKAKSRISIITPYLILDHEMETALTLAAKNGIDVRIIIPGIPDKKIVYALTLTNAELLAEHGVKIYLYERGFTHAKVVLVDDKIATVGTVNMDFRSLYLHFECGVWMYKNKITKVILKDFEETMKQCREMTLEKQKKRNWFQQLWRAVLLLLAPLL